MNDGTAGRGAGGDGEAGAGGDGEAGAGKDEKSPSAEREGRKKRENGYLKRASPFVSMTFL